MLLTFEMTHLRLSSLRLAKTVEQSIHQRAELVVLSSTKPDSNKPSGFNETSLQIYCVGLTTILCCAAMVLVELLVTMRNTAPHRRVV